MNRFAACTGIAISGMILTGLKGQPTMQENAPPTTEHVGQMTDFPEKPSVTRRSFGEVDGQKANLYTLRNTNGMTVGITDYGATVTSVIVPDRNGNPVDVVLGFDSVEEYAEKSPYFGCMAGRVGNRIENGKFQIDGDEYTLATNNDTHHLHGGEKGFDKHIWAVEAKQSSEALYLVFTRISPDGEEGYPGSLDTTVTYRLGNDNTLAIDVKATADQATPCNIVHHSYWNLGGHDSGSALQEILEVDAQRYTPTDSTLIPTGELQSVEGTPFDFRTPKAIGRDIGELPPMGDSPGGYDMNFVVDGVPDRMRRVTRSTNADTGIVMTISADQPGVQFYTGNWLDGIEGKDGAKYDQNGGYCLETQFFPDSVNHQGEAGWPDAVLRPGETYSHSMVHAFTVQ